MVRRRPLPLQTWRTFLTNHAHQLIAADFFVVDGDVPATVRLGPSRLMIAGASCMSPSRSILRPPRPCNSFATRSPGTKCLDISSAIVIMRSIT
jgi:hypothetical protein